MRTDLNFSPSWRHLLLPSGGDAGGQLGWDLCVEFVSCTGSLFGVAMSVARHKKNQKDTTKTSQLQQIAQIHSDPQHGGLVGSEYGLSLSASFKMLLCVLCEALHQFLLCGVAYSIYRTKLEYFYITVSF